MSMRTNRKTKGTFKVKRGSVEEKIMKEFGIKRLTPRVDYAVAMVREQERDPLPMSEYLTRWRAYTKDFTEAEWDELTRRLLI